MNKKTAINILRKMICVLYSIVLLNGFIVPIEVKASDNASVIITNANYKTEINNPDQISFSIYSMDRFEFKGHLMVKDSTGIVNVDTDVEGSVSCFETYYICDCEFNTSWIFVKYKSKATITVYPLDGMANVQFGGEGWIATLGEYNCKGTISQYYESRLSFNEKDMQMSMALSNAMYSGNNEIIVANEITNLKLYYLFDEKSIVVYGYTNDEDMVDSDKDNVPFAIINRKNDNDSLDIIVSIRGTYYDEWIGNTELTGKAFDSNQYVHDNFRKAELSIIDKIKEYYSRYQDKYDKINLIITGHSRGAAVANLYAKDAIDVMNGTFSSSDNIKEEDFPIFDNITAYTFACPNVEKVKDSKLALNMENNYTSIYNFWFDTDIVPTVAPTLSFNGMIEFLTDEI